MESGESFDDLDENIPYFLLLKLAALLFVLEDLLEEVTAVRVLHDDAGW